MWRKPNDKCRDSVTGVTLSLELIYRIGVFGENMSESGIGGTQTAKSNTTPRGSLPSPFAIQGHALHYRKCPKGAPYPLHTPHTAGFPLHGCCCEGWEGVPPNPSKSIHEQLTRPTPKSHRQKTHSSPSISRVRNPFFRALEPILVTLSLIFGHKKRKAPAYCPGCCEEGQAFSHCRS